MEFLPWQLEACYLSFFGPISQIPAELYFLVDLSI